LFLAPDGSAFFCDQCGRPGNVSPDTHSRIPRRDRKRYCSPTCQDDAQRGYKRATYYRRVGRVTASGKRKP
jgi:hypothetical protein